LANAADGWAGGDRLQRSVGGLFFLLITVGAASRTRSPAPEIAVHIGLNDFTWLRRVDFVPARDADHGRTFGLWRAGLISNALFAAGRSCVLVLLAAPRG